MWLLGIPRDVSRMINLTGIKIDILQSLRQVRIPVFTPLRYRKRRQLHLQRRCSMIWRVYYCFQWRGIITASSLKSSSDIGCYVLFDSIASAGRPTPNTLSSRADFSFSQAAAASGSGVAGLVFLAVLGGFWPVAYISTLP